MPMMRLCIAGTPRLFIQGTDVVERLPRDNSERKRHAGAHDREEKRYQKGERKSLENRRRGNTAARAETEADRNSVGGLQMSHMYKVTRFACTTLDLICS